jgi:DNA polymerase III subunit gamma/tau
MSEYIVTARKWRPNRFEDVVGQEHVTRTLRNALVSQRIAHAYLFGGPRGVGKTTTARLLAKAVNCLHPDEHNPDNACANCVEIAEGRSFDVLEIDGASNRGVEEIRNLRESVRYAPTKGRYKVYVIDEVHMLTKEAFNALLKTLEEPPAHVIFIFATTEVHKVPLTILSRCQRFDFRRISISLIAANLRMIAASEGLELDEDALLLIARKGDGSLRDAQSFFDQVIALCGKMVTHAQILEALNIVDQEVFFRTTDLVQTHDPAGGIALVEELMSRGYDLKEFVSGLQEHFRNILIANATGSTELIEASDLIRERYKRLAEQFTVADILRSQKLIAGTEAALRYSAQPRFKLEADLVQLVTMHRAVDVRQLVDRIDELKKKLIEAAPQRLGTGEQLRSIPPAPPPVPIRKTGMPPGAATRPPQSAPSPPPSPSLSPAELQARWPEFITEIRKERISLASVLEQTEPLGVADGSIRIGCTNEFQLSSVSRNKELLAEIVFRVFHVRHRILAESHESPPQVDEQSGPRAERQPDMDEHPMLKVMRKELGAEPL